MQVQQGAKTWIEPRPIPSRKLFFANIHLKLQEAASIAKAAEVCAESGNIQTAVKMLWMLRIPPIKSTAC
jgi:hypothetical protein